MMSICMLFIKLAETEYAKSEHSTPFRKIFRGPSTIKRKRLLTVFILMITRVR